MRLNELSDNAGALRTSKRIARGIGCGKGKTAGRGHRGQKCRSGVALKAFEGGQTPIRRRLPKRGFAPRDHKVYQLVNLFMLQKAVDAGRLGEGAEVTREDLAQAGLIRRSSRPVKLLAKGELRSKLTVHVDISSESAAKAVASAGGRIQQTQGR